MKKVTIAIIAAATVSACATPDQMVGAAHDECGKIGYDTGSAEYTACVERGYRGTKATQDAAVAATTSAVIGTAIIQAMF